MTLVILDCDGVLVDSERITTGLLGEVATELGWPVSVDESVAIFKGRDLHDVQRMIEERIGRALGEGFIPSYRERMARQFEERGVPPIDGAPALLDRLDSRGVSHAVASNAPQEKMRMTLGQIETDRFEEGWFGRFNGRRFSAYEVGKWKPDPALFLHAAEAMGVEPESCVVVEDSKSGIAAGVAAGMRVIGLADLSSPDELASAGAHEVRTSLTDVGSVLEAWTA